MTGLLLATSALLGVGFTWLARRLALRLGVVSWPNPIVRQHVCPVPYLGGLGVGLAIAATLAMVALAGPEVTARPWRGSFVVGGLLFLGLGLLDDLHPLAPAGKFAAQGVAAALAIAAGPVPALTGLAALDVLLAWSFIVTLVNAVNLTDVCDGLVGGLIVVSASHLALSSSAAGEGALIVAGAVSGFLVFNLPPARIFLGDAGSHLLGFLLAELALTAAAGGSAWPAWPQAALVCAVPLFELAFITVMRWRKGIPWWRGSPDHLSLRLQAAGLSRWQANACAWTAAAFCCLVAWGLASLPAWGQTALVVITVACLSACWVLLSRWEDADGTVVGAM